MKQERKITQLPVLLVAALYCLCILGVLLAGAGVYQRLVERGEETFSARTGRQYVLTRVRQGERAAVGEFGGCPALVLEEQATGKRYLTRIYCYEGWLRELYSTETAALKPENGEKVLPAWEFSCALEGRVLRMRLDGREICVELPVGMEVGP